MNLLFEENKRYYFWDKKRSCVGEILITRLTKKEMTFTYLNKTYTCPRSYAAWKLYNYPSDVKRPIERKDALSTEYKYDDDKLSKLNSNLFYSTDPVVDDEFDENEYLYGEYDRAYSNYEKTLREEERRAYYEFEF